MAFALACLCGLPTARAAEEDFAVWIEAVKREALARGISAATVAKALDAARPIDKVLELDRRQPEFVDTFWNYLGKRISSERVKKGRDLLDKHQRLFAGLASEYAVPPRYLVSFWAMETNFGEYTGGFPVIEALATLAYDARRAEFFRGELLAALEILDARHIPQEAMKGSWAGAMGQMQFMPSTFRRYAVDADADGRSDIWNSLPDAMASAANYLTRIGWRDDETWGREVRLPKDFDWRQSGLETRKPVKAWAALGVTQADGKPLPASQVPGAILLPQGYDGPAFLVYRNFDAIMAWNRSINYALSVALLADRLRGLPAPRSGRLADNRRMTREQAIELQTRLAGQGFDIGKADGILGARTRTAVRAYQERAKLPADGYASLNLLEHLRAQDTTPVAAPEQREAPNAGSDASDTRQVHVGEPRHG
jgi:membrane-bound lytic murein transglycosylase B